MKEQNLHIKLIEKLVDKKFEHWKEEFIKKLKASPDFDDEDRDFIDKLAGEKLT